VINKFYLLCVIFSGSPDLTLKTCLVQGLKGKHYFLRPTAATATTTTEKEKERKKNARDLVLE